MFNIHFLVEFNLPTLELPSLTWRTFVLADLFCTLTIETAAVFSSLGTQPSRVYLTGFAS
jgi:hypothetical protein